LGLAGIGDGFRRLFRWKQFLQFCQIDRFALRRQDFRQLLVLLLDFRGKDLRGKQFQRALVAGIGVGQGAPRGARGLNLNTRF
jgi:hypothetical protein